MNKPTTHDACFEQTVAAIPGFATVPNTTRTALFSFIRARTYVYQADRASELHEIISSVTDDADKKFEGRIDGALIDETCRELITTFNQDHALMTNARAASLDAQLRRREEYARVEHPIPPALTIAAIARRIEITEEEVHRRNAELHPQSRDA